MGIRVRAGWRNKSGQSGTGRARDGSGYLIHLYSMVSSAGVAGSGEAASRRSMAISPRLAEERMFGRREEQKHRVCDRLSIHSAVAQERAAQGGNTMKGGWMYLRGRRC